MGRKIIVPESILNKWRKRLEDGHSIESIARDYGLNHGTVRKQLGITAFEGRLGRSVEGRQIHKHLIHMDKQTQEWVTAEAARINCTIGLFVEYCIETMREASATDPVSRDDIKQHLEMMRNKESN